MISEEVKEILNKINNNNYECFVVGGFVRDYLLNRHTTDVDICTNALVSDLIKIFPEGVVNYLNAGIEFKTELANYTISTYRKESNYQKRTPQNIEFIEDVKQDLKRRDFTINTILLDKDFKVIDYLGGVNDLKNSLIKEVADITVDPLRILRAIRLATTLNFQITSDLDKKIMANSHLVKNLSSKRIKEETLKIINSTNYRYGFNLLKKYNLIDIINAKEV